jgi:hypothetical protein
MVEAEQAYAPATERGRDPHSGLAALRMAQGRVDLAAASRRVLRATTDPLRRTTFLPAHVEIMRAAADLGEARRASDELARGEVTTTASVAVNGKPRGLPTEAAVSTYGFGQLRARRRRQGPL